MTSITVEKLTESAEKRQPIEIDGKAYFVLTDKDYLKIMMQYPDVLKNKEEQIIIIDASLEAKWLVGSSQHNLAVGCELPFFVIDCYIVFIGKSRIF